jgi:hypothetical protein
LRRLQGTIQKKEDRTFKDGSTEHFDSTATVKQTEASFLWLWEGTSTKNGPFGTLGATNPKYTFEMRRSGEKGWLLLDTNLRGEQLSRLSPPRELVESEVLLPISVPWSTLSALVRRPSFHIVRCHEREGSLIEVEFENPHPIPKNSLDPVLGGSVLLDPNRFWCVRSYNLRYEDGAGKFLRRAKMTYGTVFERYPVLQHV